MPTPLINTSAQLQATYRTLRQAPRFISQFLNPAEIYFEKEKLEFDVDETGYGMAPFVRSNAPGIPTRESGWVTKSMSPAYVKMKDGITVADNQPIWYVGERAPYSTLSDAQKFNIARNNVIVRHSNMKQIREEWMNVQLMRTGSINVVFQGRAGRPEDTYLVDFQRDANLTVAPALTWENAAATPVSDLEAWFIELADRYEGTVTDVIMGRNVPQHLVLHEDFNDQNRANARMLARNFDTGRLTYTENDSVREIGSNRSINYLSYSGRYHKADGTRDYYVKPNEVLIVGRKEMIPRSMMLRGSIRDVRTLSRNIDMYQKEWEVQDPSGINLLSQSNMLAATLDANFCLRATVLP